LPHGAGLSIRRCFAEMYVESCRQRPAPVVLGRSGNGLLSGEDYDLALHACRAGYLAAALPELTLTHLIPARRLDPDYIVQYAAGHAASYYHLARLWGWDCGEKHPLFERLRFWRNVVRSRGMRRRIVVAENDGRRQAQKAWKRNGSA
jgi:hypothetical protein